VVTLVSADGSEKQYDNNGNEYPLQDDVLLQAPQSCVLGSSGALTLVAAVRNDVVDNGAEASISYKVSQARSPIPQLRNATVEMQEGQCVGLYTLYTTDYTIEGDLPYEATVDITSGSNVDSFKRIVDIGGTCREFANPAPCNSGEEPTASTSTPLPPVTESTTATEETASASPTTGEDEETTSPSATTTDNEETVTSTGEATPTASPHHRESLGEYNLVSCWTEGNGTRALSDAVMADDEMTLEMCMEFCEDYVFWGTEYGRECEEPILLFRGTKLRGLPC
jgi:hypothetical protein